MSLKVIGAGFGRTGTLSLKHALERLLGGRCYHMIEVMQNPEHIDVWARKARGEDVDPDDALRDYVATVDWPTTSFYAELAERHPDAKVILTVRDPQRWYESAKQTIFALSQRLQAPPVSWFLGSMRLRSGLPTMLNDLLWGPRGQFGGQFEDRAHAISVYEAHVEEVQRRIPSERLLVYQLRDGWAPLCEFLGVPEPSEPVPHVNDRDEMLKRIKVITAVSWLVSPLSYPLSRLRR